MAVRGPGTGSDDLRSTSLDEVQGRTQDFLKGRARAEIFLYNGQEGAKYQPNVSTIPCCGPARSSHRAKIVRTHTAKVLMTYFNRRNPENPLLGWSQGEGPGPPGPHLG